MASMERPEEAWLTVPVDGAPFLAEGVEMWATPEHLCMLRGEETVEAWGSFSREVVELAAGPTPPLRFWDAAAKDRATV